MSNIVALSKICAYIQSNNQIEVDYYFNALILVDGSGTSGEIFQITIQEQVKYATSKLKWQAVDY